jgi:hypothetical protein
MNRGRHQGRKRHPGKEPDLTSSSEIACAILEAVAKGVDTPSKIAEKLSRSQGRISQIAGTLIEAKQLKKAGRRYVLPRSASIRAIPAPKTVGEGFPVKASEATEQAGSEADNEVKNSQISDFYDLGLGRGNIKSSSFCHGPEAKPKRKIKVGPLFFVALDWRDFLDLATLPRKAGCDPEDLPRLVYKEAADNACDAGQIILVKGWTDPNGNRGVCLKDDGPGLESEQVLIIYSPNRARFSSKHIRRVLRGLLGNGGRVIGGAVAASGGTLIIETRGHRFCLEMDMATGKMVIQSDESIPFEPGLTLYIALGSALAFKEGDFDLAKATIQLSRHGHVYSGPSSPWWYGSHDLLRLAQEAQPDSITFSRLCRLCGFVILGITQPFWQRPAKELSFAQIENALKALRARNKPVPAKRLGATGPQAFAGTAYAKELGIASLDGAELPYVWEAWAKCARPQEKANGELKIELLVNRSMTPYKLYGASTSDRLTIHGCGLHHYVLAPRMTGDYTITLSVITPYLPFTSEGKEPSLKHLLCPVLHVVYKAARKAHGALDRPDPTRIKEAAWQVMEKAYQLASGNGRYPALARQIMYGARPDILLITGLTKFSDKYFSQTLLPDYLRAHPAQTANWNIAFDPRGHGTEPHTGYKIAMGTLAVRAYLEKIQDGITLSEVIDLPSLGLYPTIGPLNRYKTVLFIEKEGFEPLLASARIAERYDVFIVSTKGMSVTALRQLVDELSQYAVKRIFVLHDFDKSGFSILGTLGVSGRRYQFKHQVEIIDLGLRLRDIDEIERLEGYRLQSEPIDLPTDPQKRERKFVSQARTLARHGATPEEIEFLRADRTELNMMYAPTFIALLERKFAAYDVHKLIPDLETLQTHTLRYRQWQLTKELLDEHQDELKKKASALPMPEDLQSAVSALLEEHPQWAWDRAVTQHADASSATAVPTTQRGSDREQQLDAY